MLSIYKRELRSYFSGMFGYVYLAFYLLFANLFTAVLCLYGRASSIEMSYGYTAFVFLLSIPMLSLRGFADEKRQKTYILLSSLPIKVSSLVLGKYLAMITLTGIGQLTGFLSVIVLSFYGKINMISTLSGTLAFFLCGCALVAIGLFISSLSENLIVCTLSAFGGMLIIYFLPELISLLPTSAVGSFAVLSVLSLVIGAISYLVTKSHVVLCMTVCILEALCIAIWAFATEFMEGLAARIFSALSVTKQLADFTTYGMLDLQGIVYFIAIICLFVYFTVISINRQRSLA